MNKRDLTAVIAKKTGLTKTKAEEVIDAMADSIRETILSGERVKILDFGIFETVERKARIGQNMHTGESVDIQAYKTVKFTPGKGFRDAIR